MRAFYSFTYVLVVVIAGLAAIVDPSTMQFRPLNAEQYIVLGIVLMIALALFLRMDNVHPFDPPKKW